MLTDLGQITHEFLLKSATGRIIQSFETAEAALEWQKQRAQKTEERGGVVPTVRLVKRVITEEEVLV